MGNCVQSPSGAGRHGAAGGGGGEGVRPVVQLRLQRRRSEKEVDMMMEEADHQQGQAGGAPPPPPVVKVKMVLTKGELGWLVARLNAGDRRLEDVLHEMARTKQQIQKREGRGGGVDGGWRPSLESIVECPAETADS